MYNDYKPSLCGACKTTIETQDHIIQCSQCPTRKLLRNKYCLELNSIMEKHMIDPTTTKIITHKVNKCLNGEISENTSEIAPDATKTLKKHHGNKHRLVLGTV
jgi:hypothetical protein